MGVDENFVYTTTPTPGAENKINPLIRINEVSNGATEDTCNGRQWLEVNVLQGRGDRNAGPLDFTDVVLTNDQAGGSGNHVSFTFPAVEYREGYSVLCMMGEDPATSPQFLITQGDTVSMLDPFGHTFSAMVYSHVEGMSAGTSYSYNDKTGSFEDTTNAYPWRRQCLYQIYQNQELSEEVVGYVGTSGSLILPVFHVCRRTHTIDMSSWCQLAMFV